MKNPAKKPVMHLKNIASALPLAFVLSIAFAPRAFANEPLVNVAAANNACALIMTASGEKLTVPELAALVQRELGAAAGHDESHGDKHVKAKEKHGDDKHGIDKVAEAKPVEDLFKEETALHGISLKRDDAAFDIKSKSDPRFKTEVHGLLEMLASTVFESTNKKLADEKGELNLGYILPDGSSLEFEYKGDRRTGETIFRLVKVKLIKPNGDDETLDATPVDDAGKALLHPSVVLAVTHGEHTKYEGATSSTVKKEWDEYHPVQDLVRKDHKHDLVGTLIANKAALSPADQIKIDEMAKAIETINVPVAIRGPVLKELITWGQRLDVLSRADVTNSLVRGGMGILVWKAASRRFGKLVVSIATKQPLKHGFMMAMTFGVLFLAKSAPEMIMSLRDTNAPPAVVIAPMTQPFNAAGSIALKDMILKLEPSPTIVMKAQAQVAARVSPNFSHNQISELEEVRNFVKDMSKQEKALGGEPRFYMGDDGLHGMFGKSNPLGDKLAKTGGSTIVMIADFEKNETIMINAFTSGKGDMVPTTASFVIKKSEMPVLFADIHRKMLSTTSTVPQTLP